VVLILDDSASMSGAAFDRAKARAIAIVDELVVARGDTVSIVLGGFRESGASVLFEQPTTDLEAVRRALGELAVTDLSTDLVGALDAANRAIAQSSAGGEIVVLSDMQASAFASEAKV